MQADPSATLRGTGASAAGINAAVADISKAGEAIKQEAGRVGESAAGSLGTFAEAVKRAGDELKEQDQTFAARLLGEAAGGLQSLSRSLNGADVEDVLRSVRSFGRSNPTAFLAGSVLAGIALGRFARSSGHHGSSGNPAEQSFTGQEAESGNDRDLDGARMAPPSAAPPSSASPSPVSRQEKLDASLATPSAGMARQTERPGTRTVSDGGSPGGRPTGALGSFHRSTGAGKSDGNRGLSEASPPETGLASDMRPTGMDRGSSKTGENGND